MPDELARVEVVFCPAPGQVDQSRLELALPCTVTDALRRSGVLERQGLALAGLRIGVWSKERAHDWLLRDRDRVEIYRPLIVDPKEARRRRYKRHRDQARSGDPSGTPKR